MRDTPLPVMIVTRLLFMIAPMLAASPLAAQVRIPPAALSEKGDLSQVIAQGTTLERERRWGEALRHYEDALRQHPGQAQLKRRAELARVHLEIGRRYADRSFLDSLRQLAPQQALDLYAEVLLKIDTYYVHRPDWADLVQHGLTHLQVAINEPAFVNHFPQPVAADQMRQFQETLRRTVQPRSVEDRSQACDTAAAAARAAARYLHIPPQATILEFTCGAAGALDPYSAYLSSEQLGEVFSQIEGNFVGLGIELKGDNHTLLIVNVIPGGPADEAKILANERIIQIDDHLVRDMSTDAAADLLKGEELSYVNVVVQAVDGGRRQLRIQRRRVEVPSVQDVMLIAPQAGVGYLNLTSFQKSTSREVDNALWSLHRQGMRSLIIDVRGNPGGLLNAAVEVADKFLAGGNIVSTRGRSLREDFDYQAHQVGTWRVPLVVLIDGDSASASEIFAGAIHDHHRGVVVGHRSYGKGSVQGIFPLTRFKSGIRLTTAKFYSPSGQAISDHGVQPDVQAHTTAKAIAESGRRIDPASDPVLQTAIAEARKASQYQVRRAN